MHEYIPFHIGNIQRLLMYCVIVCYIRTGGGPFNRLATLLAHNYLVHYPIKTELRFMKSEIEFDIQRMITHIKSFLISLKS